MEIIVRCTKLFNNETLGEAPEGSYIDFDVVEHPDFDKYTINTSLANWPTYAQLVVDEWNQKLPEYYKYEIIAVHA